MLLLNDQEKKIKIIDFGIAGVAANFKMEDIDTGSLSYMAPECFSLPKDRKIDGGVDVWALGVILFGMVMGYLPFKGNTNNEKIQAIKNTEYKIPNSAMNELSDECIDVIRRCLDPNPKTRISMGDMCSHPWLNENFFPQLIFVNTDPRRWKQLKRRRSS